MMYPLLRKFVASQFGPLLIAKIDDYLFSYMESRIIIFFSFLFLSKGLLSN